ncbi:hypothetical protein PoB_002075200 [Plakobranchus ocellatus]|uniref:Uncharacterized protein n=1 Tax=Plakobranchus ocellatus TaxID=259542 RepID=A0AAV3ZG13_9GAST|nr:hypothetical protein PoB_002075200 [Plakobranchus ocellatus]
MSKHRRTFEAFHGVYFCKRSRDAGMDRRRGIKTRERNRGLNSCQELNRSRRPAEQGICTLFGVDYRALTIVIPDPVTMSTAMCQPTQSGTFPGIEYCRTSYWKCLATDSVVKKPGHDFTHTHNQRQAGTHSSNFSLHKICLCIEIRAPSSPSISMAPSD